MLTTLIYLVIELLALGLVFCIIQWAISLIPGIPPQIRQIILLIVGVIMAIYILYALLGMVGSIGSPIR